MLLKLLKKYAPLAALLAAVTVQAQTAPPKPIPAGEMKVRAEEIGKEINEDNRHVLHLQALARKEKDVIKLTCINDKLVQIKAQMNLFDTANLQLEATVSTGDDAPRAAFADVEKAGADVKKLRGEADACAGALEMYKQESKTDVERPDLDDPTEGGPFTPDDQMDGTEVDPPGFATPWR
jgi:hypothetical protein